MSSKGFIAEELDQVCEFCGKITECRPYGPNDEQVCVDCGMKDPATVKLKMRQYIFGDNNDS